MAVLEKTNTINAPVDKVFGFLIKPENWKEVDPNIIDIRDVQSLQLCAVFNPVNIPT